MNPGSGAAGVINTPPMPEWLIYTVIGIVFLGLVMALGSIRNSLTSPTSTWSLANALSEEADLTVTDGAGIATKKTVLVASTSRLIALMGCLVIMALLLCIGVFEVWDFAHTGTIPGATDVLTFLAGGLTLFAPYAVNKVAAAVSP